MPRGEDTLVAMGGRGWLRSVGCALALALAAMLVAAPANAQSPRLAAAGDIACAPGDLINPCRHGATADVLERLAPTAVATLGDNQYENGELLNFQASFGPSWGRFNPRMRPSLGNHEYGTPGAAGYFDYFASAGVPTGERGRGYYSYDLGAWHVVVLNSQCAAVSCAPGSPQQEWLRRTLAAHPNRCTLAYWHHPRFSSGRSHEALGQLWSDLYFGGADVVLAAHDHFYERFSRLDAAGNPDPQRGIREFIVGTGGKSLGSWGAPHRHSEVRSRSFGVLELTLRPTGYGWRFVPAAGSTFTDAGSAPCSGAAPAAMADRTPPELLAAPVPGQRLRTVLRRGLAATFRCSEPCSLRARVRVGGGTARRLGLARRARSVVIGSYSAELGGGSARRARIRLTRRARRALRRARRVRLTLSSDGGDAAGNRATLVRRTTVRR